MDWKVSEIFEPRKLSINEWSEEDRPREKLAKYGASRLSTAELLGILIGSGNTTKNAVELMKEILHDCDDSLKQLGRMDIEQLMEYNGIGEAKAITILAACELGKRREHEEAEKIETMGSSECIYRYIYPKLKDLTTEEAWVLLLNNKMNLLKAKRLSDGGYSETAVDVRRVIREALLANATVVVLIHNHPSGDPRPSRDDNGLTNQISDACRMMRMYFADHVIVGDGKYYSYRDEGKL